VRQYRFVRGFVEWVEIDSQLVLNYAPALRAAAPFRQLKLVKATPWLDELAACPMLSASGRWTLRERDPCGGR
jgi:hypothetical protein